MIIPVWLIYKKGEPRIYTSSVCPPDDRVERWRKEGFSIYRAEVLIPAWDKVDGSVFAQAEEV